MASGPETIDRLGFQWRPEEIVLAVKAELAQIEAKGTPSFLAAYELSSQYEKPQSTVIETRIAEAKKSIVLAVMRSMHMHDEVDWEKLVKECDPHTLYEILTTVDVRVIGALGIKKSSLGHISRPALSAIRKRYGNEKGFIDALNSFPLNDSTESASIDDDQEGDSRDVEKIYEALRTCKTSEDVQILLRSLGLPGDYFADHLHEEWPRALWRHQQMHLMNIANNFEAAVEKDERFGGSMYFFRVWIQELAIDLSEKNAGEIIDTLVSKHQNRSASTMPIYEKLHSRSHMHGVINGVAKNCNLSKEQERNICEYVIRNIERYPYGKMDDSSYAFAFPFSRNDSQHLWARTCSAIDERERSAEDATLAANKKTLELCQELAALLLDNDCLNWCGRIHWCSEPHDFKRLFRLLGISSDEWRDEQWMLHIVQLRRYEVGRDLTDLVYAINLRFGNYEAFTHWMDGRPDERTEIYQRVYACRSRADVLSLVKDLGIGDFLWKCDQWLLHKSKMSPERGGIGKDLSHLIDAFNDHPNLSAIGMGTIRGYRDLVHSIEPDITSDEQAWEVVFRYAEYFGMSVDELLRQEHNDLFERHSSLEEARSFLTGTL